MSFVELSSVSRGRSKSYPAISLREAVDRCRVLYEQDGWTETLAETAAVHWGYGGLNGGSRPILAALKQFGLLEYIGSGDALRVKLTEVAKRILRPVHSYERRTALQEAMLSPKLYASLNEKFPDWKLPSEPTLSARLEREEGIQAKAVKALLADIKDSVAFLKEVTEEGDGTTMGHGVEVDFNRPEQKSHSQNKGGELGNHPQGDTQTYPMPGGESYVVLPKVMTREEAERTKKWIENVVVAAIKFAGDLD